MSIELLTFPAAKFELEAITREENILGNDLEERQMSTIFYL